MRRRLAGTRRPEGSRATSCRALDVADRAGPTTTDGCTGPFTNAAAVAGNIAFINRGGTCGFAGKTKNAQDARAPRPPPVARL